MRFWMNKLFAYESISIWFEVKSVGLKSNRTIFCDSNLEKTYPKLLTIAFV